MEKKNQYVRIIIDENNEAGFRCDVRGIYTDNEGYAIGFIDTGRGRQKVATWSLQTDNWVGWLGLGLYENGK